MLNLSDIFLRKMAKKIGILTSGGDCSGLNSIIRAAFIRSKILGYELIGIKKGLKGLVEQPMNYSKIDDCMCDESFLNSSGSALLSNTKLMTKPDGTKYSNEECTRLAVEGCKKLKLNGLIYIGGDGSLSIMNNLLAHSKDLNIVAVPKTIDNDVSGTDFSVGFATAVEVVTGSIENIRTTAISHERVMVVEVMGRDAGYIAMYSGIATGADIILVPEFAYDSQKILEYIRNCYKRGKNYGIIIVAEAVEANDFKHHRFEIDKENKFSQMLYRGIGTHIASMLKENGFDSRAVTLGHTQRGGKTAILDRIVGSGFGVAAVDAIDSGKHDVMLSYKNNNIITIPIKEISQAINKQLSKEDICVCIAQKLGIYIGEI